MSIFVAIAAAETLPEPVSTPLIRCDGSVRAESELGDDRKLEQQNQFYKGCPRLLQRRSPRRYSTPTKATPLRRHWSRGAGAGRLAHAATNPSVCELRNSAEGWRRGSSSPSSLRLLPSLLRGPQPLCSSTTFCVFQSRLLSFFLSSLCSPILCLPHPVALPLFSLPLRRFHLFSSLLFIPPQPLLPPP